MNSNTLRDKKSLALYAASACLAVLVTIYTGPASAENPSLTPQQKAKVAKAKDKVDAVQLDKRVSH